MQPGLTHRLREYGIRSLAVRPTLLALAMSLATPVHAGWVDRMFGASDQTQTTKDHVSEPANVPSAPTKTLLAYSSPVPAATPADILGNSDEETDDADDNADNADDSSDSAYLPEVEESDLADTDDFSFDINELTELGDLWEHMRKSFQMDLNVDNDRISTQRNWYLQNEKYLNRVAIRASRYLHYTLAEAEKRGLPSELALLPVIESAYDPFAYSHADAAGMWQFIPGTARYMGLKLNNWFDGRRDIIESTRAGYDFLTLLYEKFGDWQLALAAYNAGPGAVQRAINRNMAAGLPTDFWSLPLPAETRAYVPRFLAVAQIINSPESFGVSLRPVIDKPFFQVIETKGSVDMVQAAKFAGISLKELYQLNPGFKQQATDPEGPYRLLVPAHLPNDFKEQIATLPAPNHTVSITHKVKHGETIYAVARQYQTTVSAIRQLNRLKKDRLTAGQNLVLSRTNVSPEFLALSNELRLNRAASASKKTVAQRYSVRKGDTLSSIAKRHHVSVASIKKWNHLKGNSVRAGQQLTLRGGNNTSQAKQQVAKSSSKNNTHKMNYKVRSGDTLSSISRRYNVSVNQIKNWNNGSNKLQKGQQLTLYVNHSVVRNL